MAFLQDVLQVPNIMERFAGKQLAGCVDSLPSLFSPPHSHRIEVLQRQAKWIHSGVARFAQGLVAMQLENVPEARLLVAEGLLRLFQRGNVGRGRWGGHSQDVIQNKL